MVKTILTKRQTKTIDWLKRFAISGIILDLGYKVNDFPSLLEKEFSIEIKNTKFDLDECNGQLCDQNPFDSIFAFDVIEHLIDPLQCLLWCRKRTIGSVYVSVPLYKPLWKSCKHFHEFRIDEFRMLVDKAGLHMTDRRILYPTHLTGIRPLLKKFIIRTLLVKLD